MTFSIVKKSFMLILSNQKGEGPFQSIVWLSGIVPFCPPKDPGSNLQQKPFHLQTIVVTGSQYHKQILE